MKTATKTSKPADAAAFEAFENLGDRVAQLMAENEQLKAALEARTKAEASASLLQFSPEVEPRRAFFEQEAEALQVLRALDCEGDCSLDVNGPQDGDSVILSDACTNHLTALICAVDFTAASAIRRFYVPLRLQLAEQELERQRIAA